MWATGDRAKHVQALVAGTHSYDTKPELVVQGFIRDSGIAFDKHRVINLPGLHSHCVPDLLVGNTAIFVDGCYYHGCPQCGQSGIPTTVHRDPLITSELRALGYTVIRIWEHELKDPAAAWKSNLLQALGGNYGLS
jgi:DNA mismatch endonuclease (patch repair protein)